MTLEILRTRNFDEWLKRLRDRVGTAKIAERIERMRIGNFGDFKFVGSGVSELRISGGPGYRVYFTRRGDTLVILLCGGDKSGQRRDIERAKDMLKEIDL